MSDNQRITITNPLPLKDQETVITRMRGERWTIDTSEPAVAAELQRKQHLAVQHDPAGHYLRFYLPANANTWRTLAAVLSPHQTGNLPNGSANTKKSALNLAMVGRESTQDRAIEVDSDSSFVPTTSCLESNQESLKGEGKDSEASITTSAFGSAGRSS